MSPGMLAEADILGLFVGVVLLIALCIGGYFAVSFVRRRLKDDDDTGTGATGGGFALSDLRDMVAAGQLSNEEYERARAKMVEALQRKANESAAAKAPPGPKHHPVPMLKDKR